jgi:hypothetical protein
VIRGRERQRIDAGELLQRGEPHEPERDRVRVDDPPAADHGDRVRTRLGDAAEALLRLAERSAHLRLRGDVAEEREGRADFAERHHRESHVHRHLAAVGPHHHRVQRDGAQAVSPLLPEPLQALALIGAEREQGRKTPGRLDVDAEDARERLVRVHTLEPVLLHEHDGTADARALEGREERVAHGVGGERAEHPTSVHPL